MDKEKSKGRLPELMILFLKLGTIGFGGPAAHIAMMQKEVVEKRKWVSQEHFLDLIGFTNLIPGPNSTELTMHIGYERAGWKGLFVAGGFFILPAVIITAILAWFYVQYAHLPDVAPFVYGIKPAVIAIIIGAMIKLGKKALKSWELALIGIAVAILSVLGISEIVLLLIAGIVGLLMKIIKEKSNKTLGVNPLVLAFIGSSFGTLKIFLIFLKVGAVLYGSGYVLFAFLETELVSTGMLTQIQLLDAVAVGQFTPGPVLSTATFIGWQLASWQGAIAATLGIFLPSFLFVLLLNPLIPRIQKYKHTRVILDAINVGSLGLIAAVSAKMCWSYATDWKALLICAISIAIVTIFEKVNSAWIVLGGVILGYALILVF